MARLYQGICGSDISSRSARYRETEESATFVFDLAIREQLLSDLKAVEHRVNGDLARCLPHVLNVSFPGIDSEALMLATRDTIATSNGSACTSASYKPSHVLLAMGVSEDAIDSAVRISWGHPTTEIPGEAIVAAVRSLRS